MKSVYLSSLTFDSLKKLKQLQGINHLALVENQNQSPPWPLECKFNPLRPISDLSQTSHFNIKGLSISEVMRFEDMITQVLIILIF